MARVQLFIDGFNLYHAIVEDAALRRCKWLNLHSLATSILSSRDSITGVFFFTAFYPGNPAKRMRHEAYIKALGLYGVTTILGDFRAKDKYCKNCHQTTTGYEEKQTDVSIAIRLLRNAVLDEYDKALLLSNDTDLIPAIRAVKELYPMKSIKVVFPPGRAACESLKLEADEHMRLKLKHLAHNQLPDPVAMAGHVIHKPSDW